MTLFNTRIATLLFCLISISNINSQISVTPNLTAQQLAEIFAGSNLTVSNATLTGSPTAVGSFTSSGFTYNSGIVLNTGLAVNAAGPNDDPNTGDNLGQAGSDILEAIGGAASRDAVILEFDFVVQSSSVQFNYIFASEEYPEFAPPNQPDFTDVFAFFISGPGITGEENIAIIPGTSLPVTIQNVNPVTNSQFYIDNIGGSEIQYDGYTTSLGAFKDGLIACQTYHLKLMISDIRTSTRNSAVFLQENSFVQDAGTLIVDSQTILADNLAREGCTKGSFTFKIPEPEPTDRIISFTIGGSAVNGVDYQHIDNFLIIPAGDTSATLYINSISDGISEGQEDIIFDFAAGGCSGTGTATMLIDDSQPIEFTLDKNDLTCFENNTGEIIVNASGGFPPYNFTYTNDLGVSNSSSTSPITGLSSGQYSINVSDSYGCKAEALVIGGLFNAGTTFLPDGSGVSYEAPLTISGFGAGDLINNVSQVQQVCLSLEHSYMGDLSIELISPSGQVLLLKQAGGGSTDLGEPVATGPVDGDGSSDPTPGNGYEYCFNANPTFGTMVSESGNNFRTDYVDNVGNMYSDGFLPAGSYQAESSFNALIGSTLNGEWKIRVTDNAFLDNGYIFNWYISLIGELPDSIVVLDEPNEILISGQSIDASCGTANGSINTTVFNAIAPYTVLWSNSAITEDINSINAGTYTINVTDNNSCVSSKNFIVNNSSSIAITPNVSPVSCFNGNNASINITVTGGQSPYIYSWSNGAITEDLSTLSPGIYTVTVTDQAGCIKLLEVEIVNASPIVINVVDLQNEICNTDNGLISVTASGGSGSYGFSWDNNSTSQTINNLSAGTYNLTVSDNLTCTATQAITVTNDISNCSSFCFLDVEENLITNETCGNSAGSVDINVLNGIFPLQISWSNGSITEDISGLNAGDYTVEITDNNSCSVIKTFTVSNNTGNLQISQALVSDEICNNNQGTINLTVSGGNLPYSFTWSNGSNTEDISNLSSNNYTVSVRDGNNCLAQQSFLILNDAGNLAVSSSVNQSFCGGNSGSIIQTVSGANGAITHSWNDGPITQNRTNLAPGNYICTTTDALGCSVQNFYTITEISGDIVILGENATSEICNNNQGSIDLTTSGTTLSYLWSNGAITEDISGLNSGNYSCLITNGQGCQLSTGTIYVGNSNGGIIVGTQTILPEICDGSNGAINVNIIGGTSPYTFSWDNGALSEDLISVSTGDYTVNVTDLNGCVKSQSFHVGENQGTLVINNAVLTNEICGNSAGNINLNLSGGTSPYVISWSNGAITEDISSLNSANYTVTIQDANGCNLNSTYFIDNTTNGFSVSHIATSEVCSNGNGAIDLNISGGQTPYTFLWSNGALTEDLTGISTGNYSCVITDNLGCTLSSGTITIGNFSNTLSATASITHATCTNDGAINLAVSGGQAPYSYVWSNGSLIEDLGAISAGIYSCVVTDVNNCSTTKTLEVIATNNNLAFTYNFTDEICNNNLGSINLSTTGGSGSLNFIWSNGGVTEDINNLNSGNYTCTITDQSSCSITTNAIQISNQSSSLQITSLTKIDEVCNNNSASINLSISGGTDPITYSWSNGSVTQDLSGLSEGVYSVVVSDASNCSTSAQVTVLNSAGNLNANLTSLVNESCTNAQGSIQLTTSGGTSPYTYSWSNGQITEDLSNLSAGTYSVLITDNLTCTTTENFTIANNGADLAIQSVAKIDESCSNNGGSINLTVSGGSQPYAYLWSNGSNLQDLTNLSAGNYTVDITDANGCTINSSYTILNQAGNLALSATTTDESCGLSNGAINVSVSGGNLPLSYSWNTGSINQDLSAISAGNYNLVVTDNFGCNVNYNTTINNTTNGLSLSLESKSDENCGLIDGAIAVNSTGSTPITFVWSNGDISEDISGVSAGTYTLTATDNLGCSTSFTETISNQTGSLAISFSNTFSPICANNNGFIDIEVSGNGPFTYGWSNGQITQDIVSLAANTYSVTITDNNNCQLTQSFNLNSSSTPLTLSSSVTGSNCGSSTGQINVSVLSGVAPYTYNWSNGAIIEDLTNLAPGDYTVIVNDFFGCTASLNETVNSLNNSTVQLFGVFENDDFCSQNQGGIFISANNVENFYINGQQDFNFGNFFNLAAGTYLITMEDFNGCTLDTNVTIGNQGNFIISQVVTDETCGLNNGAVNISINDFGQGLALTYDWSNGAITQDISNLSAGTYTVDITDNFGCTMSSTAIVNNQTGTFDISNAVVTQANCGTASGAINITIAGGTSPYTFMWSNGAITEDVSALVPGDYSVTVSDNANCSLTQTFTINNSFQVSGVVTNSACSTANGAVNITTVGGSLPNSYLWSNGAITEDLANVNAGTYSVTVTDNVGCSISASFVVNELSGVQLFGVFDNDDFCSQNQGSIFMSVNGVENFYINGQQDFNFGSFNNLAAGTYLITMEDFNGCTLDTNVTIGNQGNFIISQVITDETCGLNNGAVNVSINDFGQGLALTYDWSNGAITQDISNLSAGTYTVDITDNFGCTMSSTAVVNNQTGTFDISNSVVTQANCGTASGAINITIAGGTSPYTFMWSNGAITEDVSALVPGDYSVTVSDNASCSLTQTFTINNSFQVSGVVTNSSCSTANGAINITTTGGSLPNTYLWSNGAITEDLANVSAGTYSVVVTDNVGCSISASFVVNELSGVQLFGVFDGDDFCSQNQGSISISANNVENFYINGQQDFNFGNFFNLAAGTYLITMEDFNGCTLDTNVTVNNQGNFIISQVVTDESCGQNNGAVNVSINDFGQGLALTYDWSNGAITQDISNLSAGTYTVDITDNFGCTMSSTAIVNNQTGTFDISNAVVSQANCGTASGAIDLTIAGGTSPYTFLWSNGAITEDVSALVPGDYIVTVSDNANCSLTQTFTINNSFQVSGVVTNSSCSTSNGGVNITTTGGSLPNTYLWSNGAITEDLANVSAGTYSVTVTDNVGCSISASFVVNELSGVQLFGVFDNDDFCSQNQGSIFMSVNGVENFYINGQQDFNFGSFNNLAAGTYLITMEDFNGCTLDTNVTIGNQGNFIISQVITDETCGLNNGAVNVSINDFGQGLALSYDWSNGANSQDLSNLSAGTYIVDITDNFGCTMSSTAVVNNQTGTFDISNAVVTQANCGTATGAINITIAGGTSPYTFMWSNGAITEDVSALVPGDYSVTVSDNASCSLTQTFTINNSFQVSGVVTNSSCSTANGAVNITTVGGSLPNTYLWSNGAITEDLANVNAGTYSVTVTDNVGCSISASFEVTTNTPFVINAINIQPDYCNQNFGTIDIFNTGFVTDYYINGVSNFGSSSFSGLAEGTYTITLEDNIGCTLDTNVYVPFGTTFTPTFVVTEQSCNLVDGAINMSVSDDFGLGTNFIYTWSNSAGTEDISALTAGTYSIHILHDLMNNFGFNCENTYDVIVGLDAGFTISATTIDANCTTSNGGIDLSVNDNGAGMTFNYSWSNGSINQDLAGIVSGTYTVNITNEFSCSVSQDITVNNLNTLNLINSAVTQEACGQNNGQIDISVSGVNPIVYSWSNGEITEDIVNLDQGNYSVNITDANNCSSTQNFTVIENNDITLNNLLIVKDKCSSAVGSIEVQASGNISNYYIDGIINSNFIFSNLLAANYLIRIESASGCTIDTLVNVPDSISYTLSGTKIDENCGQGNGSIDLTTIGGTNPFIFDWITGSNTEDLTNLIAGNYEVNVSDNSGCMQTLTFDILNQTGTFVVSDTILTDASCNSSNGNIDITVTGGIEPYIFLWSNGEITEDIFALDSGIYNVTITDNNNCVISQSYAIDSLYQVFDVPTVTFINPSCSTCNDGSIDVTIANATNYTFKWNNNATTEDISTLISGDYTLTLTNALLCDTTINVKLNSTQSNNLIFTLAPNPVFEFINIQFNFPNGESGKILIYDLLGQVVYESKEMNSGILNLNSDPYRSATYFVAMKSSSIFERIKFEIIK